MHLPYPRPDTGLRAKRITFFLILSVILFVISFLAVLPLHMRDEAALTPPLPWIPSGPSPVGTDAPPIGTDQSDTITP